MTDAVAVTRWEYVLFVFIFGIGVLQLVGWHTGLKGMLLIRNRWVTYLLALAAMGYAFFWFLVRDSRWDTVMRHTGLEGKQQFAYFCLGAFMAYVFTMVVPSLINWFRPSGHCSQDVPRKGLDRLRDKGYIQALICSLKSKEDQWFK
jgi:uncharacterized membrane protein YbhN (UPF0104 family)